MNIHTELVKLSHLQQQLQKMEIYNIYKKILLEQIIYMKYKSREYIMV